MVSSAFFSGVGKALRSSSVRFIHTVLRSTLVGLTKYGADMARIMVGSLPSCFSDWLTYWLIAFEGTG